MGASLLSCSPASHFGQEIRFTAVQMDGLPQRANKGVHLEPSALVAAAAEHPDLGYLCVWQVAMERDSQSTWNNWRGSRRTCRRNRAGDSSQPHKDGMNSIKHRMCFRQALAAAARWVGRPAMMCWQPHLSHVSPCCRTYDFHCLE